jgi:hypothetical protein
MLLTTRKSFKTWDELDLSGPSQVLKLLKILIVCCHACPNDLTFFFAGRTPIMRNINLFCCNSSRSASLLQTSIRLGRQFANITFQILSDSFSLSNCNLQGRNNGHCGNCNSSRLPSPFPHEVNVILVIATVLLQVLSDFHSLSHSHRTRFDHSRFGLVTIPLGFPLSFTRLLGPISRLTRLSCKSSRRTPPFHTRKLGL